jgi:hypothetical protein
MRPGCLMPAETWDGRAAVYDSGTLSGRSVGEERSQTPAQGADLTVGKRPAIPKTGCFTPAK